MNLFGKKKVEAPRASTVSAVDTVKTLTDTLDTLEKRENFISKKVDTCLLEAKTKLAKKDKKGIFITIITYQFCILNIIIVYINVRCIDCIKT